MEFQWPSRPKWRESSSIPEGGPSPTSRKNLRTCPTVLPVTIRYIRTLVHQPAALLPFRSLRPATLPHGLDPTAVASNSTPAPSCSATLPHYHSDNSSPDCHHISSATPSTYFENSLPPRRHRTPVTIGLRVAAGQTQLPLPAPIGNQVWSMPLYTVAWALLRPLPFRRTILGRRVLHCCSKLLGRDATPHDTTKEFFVPRRNRLCISAAPCNARTESVNCLRLHLRMPGTCTVIFDFCRPRNRLQGTRGRMLVKHMSC